MSGDVGLNPNARVGQPHRAVTQNLEERLLIARLFGRPVPGAEQGMPVTPATEERGFSVPHLGQNVDLLA